MMVSKSLDIVDSKNTIDGLNIVFFCGRVQISKIEVEVMNTIGVKITLYYPNSFRADFLTLTISA